MNYNRILQSNSSNGKGLWRQIYNHATIGETNNSKSIGKRTKIQGWVKAVRKMKQNIFLDVNDGSSSQPLQVVLSKDIRTDKLGYGCSISAEGEISQAPNGRAELQAESVTVIGSCDLENYPFLPRKQYSIDYVRQHLHLRPRTKTFSNIMRLRDIATNSVRDYFRNRNFINIHTPILTSNDCEGAGEIFFVQPNSKNLSKDMKKEGIDDLEAAYFNTKAYLTVSGQLHLEACARALSRVYNFSPIFRAENSKSRLHLSEFYMIEAEIAFITSIQELAAEAELLIKSVTMSIFEKGVSELQTIKAIEPAWLTKDFGCITYNEAIEILDRNSDKLNVPVKHGVGFVKEHELFLTHHNGDVPLFIVEWPRNSKPFYAQECKDGSSKVQALDLLTPLVGELIGGSLRENDCEKLKSKLPPGVDLEWYLDIRKFGNVPTAGFGLGFERYLQLILGVPNIKDVIPFPRWPHNCSL